MLLCKCQGCYDESKNFGVRHEYRNHPPHTLTECYYCEELIKDKYIYNLSKFLFERLIGDNVRTNGLNASDFEEAILAWGKLQSETDNSELID